MKTPIQFRELAEGEVRRILPLPPKNFNWKITADFYGSHANISIPSYHLTSPVGEYDDFHRMTFQFPRVFRTNDLGDILGSCGDYLPEFVDRMEVNFSTPPRIVFGALRRTQADILRPNPLKTTYTFQILSPLDAENVLIIFDRDNQSYAVHDSVSTFATIMHESKNDPFLFYNGTIAYVLPIGWKLSNDGDRHSQVIYASQHRTEWAEKLYGSVAVAEAFDHGASAEQLNNLAKQEYTKIKQVAAEEPDIPEPPEFDEDPLLDIPSDPEKLFARTIEVVDHDPDVKEDEAKKTYAAQLVQATVNVLAEMQRAVQAPEKEIVWIKPDHPLEIQCGESSSYRSIAAAIKGVRDQLIGYRAEQIFTPKFEIFRPRVENLHGKLDTRHRLLVQFPRQKFTEGQGYYRQTFYSFSETGLHAFIADLKAEEEAADKCRQENEAELAKFNQPAN